MTLRRHWEHNVMHLCIRNDISGLLDVGLEEVRIDKKATGPNDIASPKGWHYRLFTDNPFFEEIYLAVNNAIKNNSPISLLVDCEHIIKVSDRDLSPEEMKHVVISNCLFVFKNELDQLYSWAEYAELVEAERKYKFWRYLLKVRFRKLIDFELDPYLMFDKTVIDYLKSHEKDVCSIIERVANELNWDWIKIKSELGTR